MLATLKVAPHPVTLIAVGSMRSAAAAFNREPELFRQKVARLFIYIGDAQGAFTEYNVALDKHAYARIMNSGLPVYWVPCFDGGFLKNAEGNASYWRGNHTELLKETPDPLSNYFWYAILRKDAKKDHLKALYEPIPEEERHAVLAEIRNLWCASTFAYVADRKFVRHGDDCMAVPVSDVQAGDRPNEPFTFLPVSVYVDPETGKELLEDTALAHKVQMYHVVNKAAYAQDMTSCVKHMYGELSKTIRNSEASKAGKGQ